MKSLAEGTVFLVPYGAGREALGVVARRQPRGSIVAVYVFRNAPAGWEQKEVGALPGPETAAFRGRMSDVHIRSGRWPSRGVHSSFDRTEWPFDRLGHRDASTGRCKAVVLDDRNPLTMVDVIDVSCEEAAQLPGDTIYAPDWLDEDLLPRLSAGEAKGLENADW